MAVPGRGYGSVRAQGCRLVDETNVIARWASLSAVAVALLLFSAVLFTLYFTAFSKAADWFVSQGVLEGLSEGAARSASAYLVGMPEIWRSTNFLSILLIVFLVAVQLSATCAVILWGSLKANSLAQYRVFELLPFALVFFLPMMALGLAGTESSGPFWIPGLNVVALTQNLLLQSRDGMSVFLSTIAVFVSNLSLALVFLGLCLYLFRVERVWSSL